MISFAEFSSSHFLFKANNIFLHYYMCTRYNFPFFLSLETDVCLNSVGNALDVNLLSLGKYYAMKAYFKVRCLS